MNIKEILYYIDPALLDYQEWLNVGMAIQHEGGSVSDLDLWSQRDTARYKPGECERKWNGFRGDSANPVTGGTLVALAKQHSNWTPPRRLKEDRAYTWNEGPIEIHDELQIIDPDWVGNIEVAAPGVDWNPVQQITNYLTAVYNADEYVSYVVECYEKEDGFSPKAGSYSRTAGQLIEELSKCNGDIGAVLGDYNPEAGGWIRPNPVDGTGVKDSNVTDYRYALIESDTMDIERQAAIYKELELPVVALVHSGGKSLHAIVRIEATSLEEYRDRVNFLHKVCNKNGLEVDGANKNVSRLSRLPGLTRNGNKQYLVGTNQGKASWEEWRNWIEEVNDDLPDIEPLSDVFGNLPPLAPPLIDGVLREGHKMLLAGPSKAGKSYLLLQLAIAVAEGKEWLGWKCTQGKVLYVNLELDRASCLHRLEALYEARDWLPENVDNIDLWNLRGKAVPMDLLAPKLIRRALKRDYKAVIIDPIYKVITGDENAADKMAHFCNQFDRVCHELGCAVIYCHHHSKGMQGQKSAQDRASGSGVFARDPDAILDLIELVIGDGCRQALDDRALCDALVKRLDAISDLWAEDISQDDMVVAATLKAHATRYMQEAEIDAIRAKIVKESTQLSAWRIEGTLREFPPFPPHRCFFDYPIHVPDETGALKDAIAEGETPKRKQRTKDDGKTEEETSRQKLDKAYSILAGFDEDSEIKLGDLADYLSVRPATVRKWINQTSAYEVDKDYNVLTKVEAEKKKAEAKNQAYRDAFESNKDLHGLVKLRDIGIAMKLSDRQTKRNLIDAGFCVENGYVKEIEE